MKNRRKQSLPTKTVINLVINEIPPYYYRNLLIATIIVAAVILAFAKFAVIDRLALADEEWRLANDVRAQVTTFTGANADYYEVREEYEEYFAGSATQGTVVDVMEVLRIIDEHLKPVAAVSSVQLAESTLSVELGGITLDEATGILLKLYETEPLVVSVEIFTASSPEGEQTSISMTIVLYPQGGAAQ